MDNFSFPLETEQTESVVRIADDKMSATLELCRPPEGLSYSLADLKGLLTENNVKYGPNIPLPLVMSNWSKNSHKKSGVQPLCMCPDNIRLYICIEGTKSKYSFGIGLCASRMLYLLLSK